MSNNPSITCTKLYQDFPFAHRQHNHDGHCSLIHGHNWAFQFTFAADILDSDGFVIDFGKLKFIKDQLNEWFDHTLVLNKSDPHLQFISDCLVHQAKSRPGVLFAKIVTVPNCGAEGLAVWVMQELNRLFFSPTDPATVLTVGWKSRNVRIVSCTVFEDSKNSATVTIK